MCTNRLAYGDIHLHYANVQTYWLNHTLGGGGNYICYDIVRMCVLNSPLFKRCQVYNKPPFSKKKVYD